MGSEGLAKKLIRETIARFPSMPALTLAKKLFREHPGHWSSVEVCRTAVRNCLGVQGNKNRTCATNKSQHRAARPAGWTDVIPVPVFQLLDWKAEVITGAQRVLILNDIHIPFHDPQALESALEFGERIRPTGIILNGDIGDHFAVSHWQKDPSLRDFPGELKALKYFLRGLRSRFGRHVWIKYKRGNHEERYDAYMRTNCPDFLGVEDFEWKNILGLDDLKIGVVDKKRPILLGNSFNLLHGHEYKFAISNPVGVARGLYLKANTHAACGHFHRSDSYTKKNLKQNIITCWGIGCLCQLHAEYSPINDWNHGFAFVETDKEGDHSLENFKIDNGKVYQ
jgi:predicted phosphodiesterase